MPLAGKGMLLTSMDVDASDEAEFITGTTLLVDGGMTAGYHQRENSPLAEPRP